MHSQLHVDLLQQSAMLDSDAGSQRGVFPLGGYMYTSDYTSDNQLSRTCGLVVAYVCGLWSSMCLHCGSVIAWSDITIYAQRIYRIM